MTLEINMSRKGKKCEDSTFLIERSYVMIK